MNERRRSIRVECELATSYRDLDSPNPGHVEVAVVKNISRGGIKLRVDVFVPIQDRLFLHLQLPTHESIEVQVVPAWIVEIKHLNKFEMGVRFVNIREEDEDKIENFQYQALLEKMPTRASVIKDLLKDNPPPSAPDKAA
jgi:c-di-GMP-binding flagellar brake protein YcgR